MGGACGIQREEEKCILGFGEEIVRKETICKTQV